jgi:hypothetical protein
MSPQDARRLVGQLQERLEMNHAWQMVDGEMVRVEVEPGSIPDGIECRDETIRLQDRAIERHRAEIDRLRTIISRIRHLTAYTDAEWAMGEIREFLEENT